MTEVHEIEIYDEENQGHKTRLQVEFQKLGLSIRFPDHPNGEEESPIVALDFFGETLQILVYENQYDENPKAYFVTKIPQEKNKT